jgi:hypothetical protein
VVEMNALTSNFEVVCSSSVPLFLLYINDTPEVFRIAEC